MSDAPRLMLIAGEHSGDMHAARILSELRKRHPDMQCTGIGGQRCRDAGMETLYDLDDMAVMGLTEILSRYFFFRRVLKEMTELARSTQPDLLILVDYAEFNLRLAKVTRSFGQRNVFYVCPQVWAWRSSRIPGIAKVVDRMLTIFPFEPAVFKDTSLKIDFIGHPLVEDTRAALAAHTPDLDWGADTRVALLPGSRRQEIERNFPTMWEATTRVESVTPNSGYIIAAPDQRIADQIDALIKALPHPHPAHWKIVVDQTRDVLKQATAAWVASGTATLETALMGCPMVVTYRVSPITYHIGRRLLKVSYIGMVNIIAGKEICRELVQNAATPTALADEMNALVTDPVRRKHMCDELKRVCDLLGDDGDAQRAADIIDAELSGSRK